ncbi:MAG TPA: hypothetical protein VNT75_12115 [Symbiobacteriaceae bacterium]|nr:hypothetical protein [Symbiobacteriaceae bacterium]
MRTCMCPRASARRTCGAPPVLILHGGGILLKLAAHAPQRIIRAALAVPSSIYMSVWIMTRKIILPMLLYMASPSPARLAAAVSAATITFLNS